MVWKLSFQFVLKIITRFEQNAFGHLIYNSEIFYFRTLIYVAQSFWSFLAQGLMKDLILIWNFYLLSSILIWYARM